MDARDIKLLKQELSHLRAFNEELHTKYKEDIIDVAKKNTELRDHFAGLAMQSLLTKVSTTVGSDSVAMAAYHVAHQMLKERSRGEKPNEIL